MPSTARLGVNDFCVEPLAAMPVDKYQTVNVAQQAGIVPSRQGTEASRRAFSIATMGLILRLNGGDRQVSFIPESFAIRSSSSLLTMTSPNEIPGWQYLSVIRRRPRPGFAGATKCRHARYQAVEGIQRAFHSLFFRLIMAMSAK